MLPRTATGEAPNGPLSLYIHIRLDPYPVTSPTALLPPTTPALMSSSGLPLACTALQVGHQVREGGEVRKAQGQEGN